MKTLFGLISLLLLTFVFDAFAVIQSAGVRTPRTTTSGSVSGGGSSIRFEEVAASATPVTGASVAACNDDDYMPLKLINLLSQEDESVAVRSEIIRASEGNPPKLNVTFTVPPIISNCIGELKVVYRRAGNDIVASYKNDKAALKEIMKGEIGKTYKDASGNDVTVTNEYINGLSSYEMYEACLSVKGILKRNQDGTTFLDRTTPGIQYKTYPVSKEFTFSSDKPVKVVFGSPVGLAREYGDLYNNDVTTTSPDGCFKLEDLSQAGVYAYSRESVRLNRLSEICKSGTFSEIRAELGSLGNAPQLKAIMEKALEKQMQQVTEKKYQELEELARTIASSTDEETLREAGSKYSQILRYLNDNVLKPQIDQLKEALTKRSEASGDERKEIDKQIKDLNDKIGYFSRASSRFKTATVIDKLLEYGIRDEVNNIAEVKLKSDLYSRVYREDRPAGRGEKLSFTQADSLLQSELRKFDTRAVEAERMYLAKTGQRTYTREIGYRIESTRSARDRVWNDDMKRIQTSLQSCQRTFFGFQQNPARCNYAMRNQSTWQRQALAKRERFNRNLGTEMGRYERYNQYEMDAARRRAEEHQSTGGFASDGLGSYGMFEDYSGSDYSSTYSMMGNQGGMGMGMGMGFQGGMGMGGGFQGGMGQPGMYGGGMGGNPYGGGMPQMY